MFETFIMLFAVIDPIGSVPVFLAVTSRHQDKDKRGIALWAVFVAACILVGFIVIGQPLLEAIDVPLPAFQIAGGIVLFLFALSMIFGDSKPDEEVEIVRSGKETAIFPLAVPSIASPGAMMAVVMMTDNNSVDLSDQILTTVIMLVVLAITLGLLMSAGFIQKCIGNAGASIVSRVMGLILASVAAAQVLEGIKIYYQL
ncbi:MAG: MarC family transcriptional regulator [Blastopirellula sp.]|nr:MAG: MarC family transcriptional regulator [Blastopirellula sp.]